MNQIVIDTSAYSAFRRGLQSVKAHFTSKHDVLVPTIVLGELRAGFATGNKQAENERRLKEFLELPNVSVINIKNTTTHEFGAIFAELKSAGKPIGHNDLWIAALSRDIAVPLLTLDSDFSHIEGLEVVSLN